MITLMTNTSLLTDYFAYLIILSDTQCTKPSASTTSSRLK